jgi:hypothetical protein
MRLHVEQDNKDEIHEFGTVKGYVDQDLGCS